MTDYRQNAAPPNPPVPDRAPLLERVDRAVFVTAEPAIKWVFWAWLGLTMAVAYGWILWG